MKLKTKLASLIIGFVMVASMLFFGVWAASSANVTLGGTISFTSTNVHAEVSGTIIGAATGTKELPKVEFKSSNATPDVSGWANNPLTFDENGSTITITITIKNLASDRKLYASVTDQVGTIVNVNKTISDGAGTLVLEPASDSATTDEATVTITLAVANTDLTVDETNYSYLIDLKDSEAIKSVSEWAEEGLTVSVSNGVGQLSSYTGSATSLTLPTFVSDDNGVYTVTTINGGLFMGNTNITNVTLPAGLISITSNTAFYGCSGLTSLIIPETVTTITMGAFNSCGFTSIEIPSKVTILDSVLFSGCTSLASITLPAGLTTIGSEAFSGCTALTDVYFKGTAEQWAAISINATGNDALTSATIHFEA